MAREHSTKSRLMSAMAGTQLHRGEQGEGDTSSDCNARNYDETSG